MNGGQQAGGRYGVTLTDSIELHLGPASDNGWLADGTLVFDNVTLERY
jgi:hypothetical protein